LNLASNKFKPAIKKTFLLLLSGAMWFAVGIMLNMYAYHWFIAFRSNNAYIFASIGFVAALVIHHFGFLKLADKNLGRISYMKDDPCIFSFMSWKSYIIVIVMISMGIALRHSSIPKQYLSVLYIGIGLALILSSIRYFRVLFLEMLKKENEL